MRIPEDILSAYERIQPYVLQTPLEYSPYLSAKTGARVWLKLEHIQRTGSFKLRGAANALLSLTSSQQAKGVLTASSGNHGMAVAYMASQLGISADIYLPETVSPTKVEALNHLGATLHFHGEDAILAERLARKTASLEGRPYISPYNDEAVIAGQGTIGVELWEQIPKLEAVFVPVGGGGLISGIGSFLKNKRSQIKVIGCQPQNSAVMYESVRAGRILDLPSLPTLSDGTAGGVEAGALTLSYCQEYVDDFCLVSEAEIRESLLLLIQKHYLMVEGAAALALASLLKQGAAYRDQDVVLILCGRKLGIENLRSLIG